MLSVGGSRNNPCKEKVEERRKEGKKKERKKERKKEKGYIQGSEGVRKKINRYRKVKRKSGRWKKKR